MKINTLLLFFTIMIYVTISYSGQIPPEDPPLNTVQAQGMIGLNFSQSGNGEQIAYFIINSNSSTGFILKISLNNRGNFKSGASIIPMTSLVLDELSGNIGTGLIGPSNLDVLAVVNSGDEFIWNPGNFAEAVTFNYMVELKADWAEASMKLAGFYSEIITVTIAPGGL